MLHAIFKKTTEFLSVFSLHTAPILGADILYDWIEINYNNGNRMKGRPLHPWELHKFEDIEDIWNIDFQ